MNTKDTITKDTITKEKIVATDTGLRLSTYLFSFIKDRNNGHKPPDLNKWGVDMDKMIRIDARDPTVGALTLHTDQPDITVLRAGVKMVGER
jgi:hypothetical protein